MITLSLVLLTSAYYSGNCVGQLFAINVRIGLVMANSNVAFYAVMHIGIVY